MSFSFTTKIVETSDSVHQIANMSNETLSTKLRVKVLKNVVKMDDRPKIGKYICKKGWVVWCNGIVLCCVWAVDDVVNSLVALTQL